VKASCVTIAVLAAATQQGFEPFAEHVVPVLLDAPKVAIEVSLLFL
jgi:hypothetical protein